MINLDFLIPAVNAQIFNSDAEPLRPVRIQANEANSKFKTQPLIAETIIKFFF